MNATIRDILEKFGRLSSPMESIGDRTDLFGAGLTSFASVEVMMALEEAFEVEFPDRMLNRRNFGSIEAIQRAVETIRQEEAA